MKGYWLGTAIFVCVGARVCVYAARSRPCRAGPAARHPLGRPLTRLLPCIQPEHQRILEYLRNTQAALHPQLLCARAVLSISRLSLLLLHRYLPLHRISPPLLHPHHPPLHPLVRHRLLHRRVRDDPDRGRPGAVADVGRGGQDGKRWDCRHCEGDVATRRCEGVYEGTWDQDRLRGELGTTASSSRLLSGC